MRIEVQRSPAKAALAVLGCAIFVVCSLAIIATGTAGGAVVGGVGLVTFTTFGVAWVALGFRRGPALVIDEQGFEDHSSAVAVGRVAWSDVIHVGEWSAFRTSHVVVEVRDPRKYLRQVPWYGRLPARANIALAGSSVTVASTGLRIAHETLLSTLREAHARFQHQQLDRGEAQ